LKLPGFDYGHNCLYVTRTSSGNAVDERTDLWSLGIVLYEMITGARPFEGETPVDIQAAILLRETPALELKDKLPILNEIIQKALAKDASLRYQSAKEFTGDLRLLQRHIYDYFQAEKEQTSSEANKSDAETLPTSLKNNEHKVYLDISDKKENSPQKHKENPVTISSLKYWGQKSLILSVLALIIFSVVALKLYQAIDVKGESNLIAVLPLTVEGASGENAVNVRKLTQDLTFSLGKITNAPVLPYNEVVSKNVSNTDLERAGKVLKADIVITGTIIIREGANDLQMQIRNLQNDAVVWERRYSLKAQDFPQSQYQIALDIANELGSPEEMQDSPAKTNYETYQLYLLGRHHLNKRSTEDYEKAVEAFKQVTIQDASFTDAYSGTGNRAHSTRAQALRPLRAFSRANPFRWQMRRWKRLCDLIQILMKP
jgi:TolB-like protein